MVADIKESVPLTQRAALSTWPGPDGTKDGIMLPAYCGHSPYPAPSHHPSPLPCPTHYTSSGLREENFTSSNSLGFPTVHTNSFVKRISKDLRMNGGPFPWAVSAELAFWD